MSRQGQYRIRVPQSVCGHGSRHNTVDSLHFMADHDRSLRLQCTPLYHASIRYQVRVLSGRKLYFPPRRSVQ